MKTHKCLEIEAKRWIDKDFHFDNIQGDFDNLAEYFMNYKFYRWKTEEEAQSLRGKRKWKSKFF